MRTTHKCPKCQNPEVLYVPRLHDARHDEMRVGSRGIFNLQANGTFEAYICRSCGFSELYVKNVADVDVASIAGAEILTA